MNLQLGRGDPVKLGRELGRGGEGAVFEVVGHTRLVAKIYHSPAGKNKADKLAAMARGCTERLAKIAAWPTDTVHDAASGAMRGFVMPRVARQKDIHVLYGPKTRLRDYPDATYRFLVHVASNVARAFAVIHDHGHVVGDVNQGGVCVSEQGTISLVDCDSFQVGAGLRTFHCDVGIPIYQPPELQNVRTFRGLPRNSNHDAFGIAVLIFQTLFLARHPFAGAFQGDGDMPIERAIRELRFAYGRDAARRQMKQPPGSLGLGAVPSAVGNLFERAFLEEGAAGRRPTAREWVTALDGYAAELRDCIKNPGHAYAKGLAACPLCAIEGRTGTLLFLPPRQASASAPIVDLEDLWRDLIPAFGAARVPAVTSFDIPEVSPPDVILKFSQARARAWKITWFGIIAAVTLAFAWHSVALAGALLFVLVGRLVRGNVPDEAQNAAGKMLAAKEYLKTLVHRMEHDCSTSPLSELERRAESLYRGLKDFPKRRAMRLGNLEPGRRERQLRRYLDRFEVKDSKIKGFGPGLFAALVSNGVETADDLTEDNLRGIAGFGPKRVAALIHWRCTLEVTFRFDPADAADAKDRTRVERELQLEYAKELTELQRTAEQIKAHATPLRGRLAALNAEVERARQELAVRLAISSAVG